MIKNIFTGSDGWIVMNPRSIHEREPYSDVPSPGTYTDSSSIMLNIYMGFSRSVKYL